MDPLSSLAASLNIQHPVTPAAAALSEALQIQGRLIAHELILLKADRFGPVSREGGLQGLDRVAGKIHEFFVQVLGGGFSEEDLLEDADRVQAALSEIRCLHRVRPSLKKTLFFADALRFHFLYLTQLETSSDSFGEDLFKEIGAYCERHDEGETRFRQPLDHHESQLLAIVRGNGNSYPFRKIDSRIKTRILPKCADRLRSGDWPDTDQFYDLVGIECSVGDEHEIKPAVAFLVGAFKMHEQEASGNPWFFKINDIEVHDNERGYRSDHVNIRRHRRRDGHHHSVCEIQVKSLGISKWGKIQRELVTWGGTLRRRIFKRVQLPEEVEVPLSDYLMHAAYYIRSCENGIRTSFPPYFDIGILEAIPDLARRSYVFDGIRKMDDLVRVYQNSIGRNPKKKPSRRWKSHPCDLPPPSAPPSEDPKKRPSGRGEERSCGRLPNPRGSWPGPKGLRR